MFITFEGPDGSGKTTILHMIEEYLKKENIEFISTREPGSKISKENIKIREIIVSPESELSNMAEAILFSADRRIHLEKLIWPAQKNKKIILCDRYFDSTFAYQGEGRGLGIDKMIELQDIVTEKTYPDLTIYFDLSIEESIERVNKRGEKNRLDKEGINFVKLVHQGYKKLIDKFPERFQVVDASQEPQKVFEQTKKIIMNFINKK